MSILYTETDGRIGFYAILTVLLILLTGCGKHDEPVHRDDHVCADITVMTPLAGLGDKGYNDEAWAGVMDVVSASGLEVSLLRPKTLEQAGEYVREWSEDENSKRKRLILPDDEYTAICIMRHFGNFYNTHQTKLSASRPIDNILPYYCIILPVPFAVRLMYNPDFGSEMRMPFRS